MGTTAVYYVLLSKAYLKDYIHTGVLILAACLLTVLMRLYAYRKIGGITGDVLGALIELTELVLPILVFFTTQIV